MTDDSPPSPGESGQVPPEPEADDPDALIFTPALLQPTGWQVLCQACGSCEITIETCEDTAGAIHPEAQDRWLRCPLCNAGIEVIAVSVREAYPAAAQNCEKAPPEPEERSPGPGGAF